MNMYAYKHVFYLTTNDIKIFICASGVDKQIHLRCHRVIFYNLLGVSTIRNNLIKINCFVTPKPQIIQLTLNKNLTVKSFKTLTTN